MVVDSATIAIAIFVSVFTNHTVADGRGCRIAVYATIIITHNVTVDYVRVGIITIYAIITVIFNGAVNYVRVGIVPAAYSVGVSIVEAIVLNLTVCNID